MTRLQIAKRAKSSVPLASVGTRRGLTPGQVSAKCLLRDPASGVWGPRYVAVRHLCCGRTSEKHGNTRVDTLRETYGEGFAAGIRGNAHLHTVLDRTGARSLSELVKNR